MHAEVIETRLAAIRQESDGALAYCPLENLLLLRGGKGIPAEALPLASSARDRLSTVEKFIQNDVLNPLASGHQQTLQREISERENYIRRGYTYREAELAAARRRYTEKANQGDSYARGELTRIKEQQRLMAAQREAALTTLRREPELVTPGPVTFLAHALVVPSSDPEEKQRRDDRIEAIAMQVAIAYEQASGAGVKDVHTPELARAAGLWDNPGFDLLSTFPVGEQRLIEVKGRARSGDVDISDNEWSAACNQRSKYWLYVVYDCASPRSVLVRIQDPFFKLLSKARGFILSEQEILNSGETG